MAKKAALRGNDHVEIIDETSPIKGSVGFLTAKIGQDMYLVCFPEPNYQGDRGFPSSAFRVTESETRWVER